MKRPRPEPFTVPSASRAPGLPDSTVGSYGKNPFLSTLSISPTGTDNTPKGQLCLRSISKYPGNG